MTTSRARGYFSRYALPLVLALAISFSTLIATSAAGAVQAPEQMVEAPHEANAGMVETDENGMEYVAGEYVVSYEEPGDAVTEEPATGSVVREVSEVGVQLVESEKIKDEQNPSEREDLSDTVETKLESDPEVDSVVPNYLAQPQWTPNDPSLSAQSNALPVIRAQRSWDLNRGGGARIAVIDSGYDTNHPEFAGTKVAASYDFINRRTNAEDSMGHGTHVASIASAVTDNGRGIAGGAPNAKLLLAKTQQPGGFTLAGTIEAVTWAANKDADAINMSFGFTGNPGPAMQDAIDYAWRKGSLPVASAGNTGICQVNYPASYDRVIGVAAVASNSIRTSWSTCGAHVDLAAPGANVLAAVPDRKYQRLSGTSMSAPYVSALAGLLGAQHPQRTSAEKYRLMRVAARDMGAVGRDSYYGYGVIDYEAALKAGR